jgi:hypothetical protein
MTQNMLLKRAINGAKIFFQTDIYLKQHNYYLQLLKISQTREIC